MLLYKQAGYAERNNGAGRAINSSNDTVFAKGIHKQPVLFCQYDIAAIIPIAYLQYRKVVNLSRQKTVFVIAAIQRGKTYIRLCYHSLVRNDFTC